MEGATMGTRPAANEEHVLTLVIGLIPSSTPPTIYTDPAPPPGPSVPV